MDEKLTIPPFLRRINPGPGAVMTQSPPKKTRTPTILPTILSDGSLIAELTFEELVAKRATWEKAVAEHEQEELELRAIRVALRKKV
jgi:hypothetical protein